MRTSLSANLPDRRYGGLKVLRNDEGLASMTEAVRLHPSSTHSQSIGTDSLTRSYLTLGQMRRVCSAGSLPKFTFGTGAPPQAEVELTAPTPKLRCAVAYMVRGAHQQ
jgi:hypothetical protein